MKFWKKGLIVVVLLVVVVVILIVCGGLSEKKVIEKSEDGKIKLIVIIWNYDMILEFEKLFRVFEVENFDIIIELVDIVLDDYDIKVIMMFLLGDMMDILIMKNLFLYFNYVLCN